MKYALLKSIEIWKRRLSVVEENIGQVLPVVFKESCPLCKATDWNCGLCPIFLKTMEFGCKKTPYKDCVKHEGNIVTDKTVKDFRKMVELLESLSCE